MKAAETAERAIADARNPPRPPKCWAHAGCHGECNASTLEDRLGRAREREIRLADAAEALLREHREAEAWAGAVQGRVEALVGVLEEAGLTETVGCEDPQELLTAALRGAEAARAQAEEVRRMRSVVEAAAHAARPGGTLRDFMAIALVLRGQGYPVDPGFARLDGLDGRGGPDPTDGPPLDARTMSDGTAMGNDHLTCLKEAITAFRATAAGAKEEGRCAWCASYTEDCSMRPTAVDGVRALCCQSCVARLSVPSPAAMSALLEDIAALVVAYEEGQSEQDGVHRLIVRQSELLRRTANALKGEPASLSLHSHADLPETAARLRAEHGSAQAENERLKELNAWAYQDNDLQRERLKRNEVDWTTLRAAYERALRVVEAVRKQGNIRTAQHTRDALAAFDRAFDSGEDRP